MMKISLLSCIGIVFCFTAKAQSPLPVSTSPIFSGSGNCILCHQSNNDAMTWNGTDISPITYWRSTMMGNASKDPLWRAMVAEEVNSFPQHQQMIETTCTKCHSPIGYTQSISEGQSGYSMEKLTQDPLANDGVSCTVCHQVKPVNFGSPLSYSGNYVIHADSIIYGPYEHSDTTLMPAVVGYRTKYSSHINQSELCATCHTLFTPTINDDGNIAGDFPEQTTYIEWKNSIYPQQNIQCQDCHMPKIYDPVKISGMGNFPERTPFWRHSFVGGNVYMLNILKNNTETLGITAETFHFDSTIARAEYNLTENSVELSAAAFFNNNQLKINLYLKNLTGHKLPTGIPLRRMWIHLKVENQDGELLFESGEWDSTGKISDYDIDYEPHYDFINSDNQVQVYEGVFTDVNGELTYTLMKADQFIKDNRIPPSGFSASHGSYDTIKIVGNAVDDSNFNKYGIYEGTGGDSITYLIPFMEGDLSITIEICYQSIKSELVDYLRILGSYDINRFVKMYDAVPNTPFIMKRIILDQTTGIMAERNSISNYSLDQNYPNPFNPATIINYQVAVGCHVTLKVFDVLGNEVATLVDEEKASGKYRVNFDIINMSGRGGNTSGVYFYQLRAGSFIETKKMILIK